jgi:murein DD-endopeptidase MepM/ murein hydrolase activator NlpD
MISLIRLSVLRCLPVLILILCFGCTTFKGPGEFTTIPGGEEEPLSSTPTTATSEASGGINTTLRGDRHGPTTPVTIAFDWPVESARLSRGFMLGRSRRKRSHWGLDLAAKKGTPILSAENGVVVYTGRAFKGYGNLVVIEHNDEWATMYAHLDKILVKEGASIERGHKIGTMGRTGRASGVHLHFEIRNNREPVNPLPYLPQGY